MRTTADILHLLTAFERMTEADVVVLRDLVAATPPPPKAAPFRCPPCLATAAIPAACTPQFGGN